MELDQAEFGTVQQKYARVWQSMAGQAEYESMAELYTSVHM